MSSHYITAEPIITIPEIHFCELWHLGEREFLSQYDKLVEQPETQQGWPGQFFK